jgi:hypothetical protein
VGFDSPTLGFNFGDYRQDAVSLHQTKILSAMLQEAIKEEVIYAVDSLGVAHPETYQRPAFSIARIFVEGGMGYMIVISLLLIALLIAAWKAPRWVKEIGIGALVAAVYATLRGLLQVCDAIQQIGDISLAVICGGLKVTLIPVLYGLIVYFISLIIRIIHKPRI